MHLEPHESAQGQANKFPLGDGLTLLSSFYTGELLEAPLLDLALPGIQGKEGRLYKCHPEPAGDPVSRGAICADGPQDFDTAIDLEMDPAPMP